jgi:hypothetical protein
MKRATAAPILRAAFPFTFAITIADNASTDGTSALADELADRMPEVRAVHLTQKGRGRALRTVWEGSDASVLAYMDIDLSTDLAALLPLVAPCCRGIQILPSVHGFPADRKSCVARSAR